MLFEIEQSPTINEKLLENFKKYCKEVAIVQCYKNKLELNVNYNIEVEQKIKNIENKFIDNFKLPWWLDLID